MNVEKISTLNVGNEGVYQWGDLGTISSISAKASFDPPPVLPFCLPSLLDLAVLASRR